MANLPNTVPILSAADQLLLAQKNNIVPTQEYLLQGSVLDSAVEILLHRLRGLCDNVDSGPETFHDHEMCFSMREYNLFLYTQKLRVYTYLCAIDAPACFHTTCWPST